MPTTTAVQVTDLHKSFGPLEVLKGIDLSVARGEVVVVMGASGSGKTTMLRCINFLETPDRGSVTVCDTSIDCGPGGPRGRHRAKMVRSVCRRAVMVFQQFNLFPHKTALQNVIEAPITVKGMPKSDAVALGERLLDRVGLADKRDEYPSRLSGGQQQRVAIARALAMEPEVVLFDEPTSSLDPELHEEVLQTMRELARDGMTMIVVTHEVKFAQDVADRVVFMGGGVILEEASPVEFFTRPQHARAQLFLRQVTGDNRVHHSRGDAAADAGTVEDL
ncbi:amino acid ABC transporter ATP-binding protein [Promicromonospora soli]